MKILWPRMGHRFRFADDDSFAANRRRPFLDNKVDNFAFTTKRLALDKLFTGGSGFIEQLKQIVELVGSPDEDELDEWVPDGNARSFLLSALPPVSFLAARPTRTSPLSTHPSDCPSKPGQCVPVDLCAKFPLASEQACDLLRWLLQMNPFERFTIEEALSHPYLESVREEMRFGGDGNVGESEKMGACAER